MPFHRNAFAFFLLLFTVVLTVWLGISGRITWGFDGPVTAHRILNYLQKWQTLAAGCLAILAATVALRGAKLAYRGAMAKVDFDKEVHERDVRRKRRGIFLRVAFALLVMRHDAEFYAGEIKDPPWSVTKIFDLSTINLRTAKDIDEAWSNLDVFPREVANLISDLRVALFNVEDARRRLGNGDIRLESTSLPAEALRDLRKALENMVSFCRQAEGILRAEANLLAE
jgi:hypothetical protein